MRRPWLLAVAALAWGACQSRPESGERSETPRPQSESRALIAQGQLDAALAKLQTSQDPDSLYLQGVVWAKKAEAAPMPTAPIPEEPLARGAPAPVAPEFKAEELTAVELFERVLAVRAEHWEARLALARLLAPHAIRRHDAEQEALARRKSPKRGSPVETAAVPLGGVDVSTARVLKEFMGAAREEKPGSTAAEALIEFAQRVGRIDAADMGYQELIKRIREKPEPMARYGDFLWTVKKDPQAAVEQYRQALIWQPDDESVKKRLAEIYLVQAEQFLASRQYGLADAQLNQATKFIVDRSSPEAAKLERLRQKLRGIRY